MKKVGKQGREDIDPWVVVCLDCDTSFFGLDNLPPRIQLIADIVNETTPQYRSINPCRGQRTCTLFFLEDGSCVDPECTNLKTGDPEAENIALLQTLEERATMWQCRVYIGV